MKEEFPRQAEIIQLIKQNDAQLITLAIAHDLVKKRDKLVDKVALIEDADREQGKLPVPHNPKADRLQGEIYFLTVNLSRLGFDPRITLEEIQTQREALWAENLQLDKDYRLNGPLENVFSLVLLHGLDWVVEKISELVVLPQQEEGRKAKDEAMAAKATATDNKKKTLTKKEKAEANKQEVLLGYPKAAAAALLAEKKVAAARSFILSNADKADLKASEQIFHRLAEGKMSKEQNAHAFGSIKRMADRVTQENGSKLPRKMA